MRDDPIVEEVHRIREALLDSYGGDVDALVEDCNRRALTGEFGDFKISDLSPVPRRDPSELAGD